MKFLSVILVVVVGLTVLPARSQVAAPAAAPEKCRIVVLNLVGRSLPESEADLPFLLTDTLAGEVGAVSGCDVVSQADIVAMLDYEREKAVCTDGSDSCLAEIGQALGAERVIGGTLGRLGEEYVLAVRLMNVRRGSVEQRAEEPVAGSGRLRHAAKNVGRRLFGAAELPPPSGPNDSEGPGGVSAPTGGGSPALVWTGAAIGGLGVAAVVGGGVLAGINEGKLADPAAHEKDAARSQGLVGLVVAGAGLVATTVGGVVAMMGME